VATVPVGTAPTSTATAGTAATGTGGRPDRAGGKPSYIPSRTFTLALFDEVANWAAPPPGAPAATAPEAPPAQSPAQPPAGERVPATPSRLREQAVALARLGTETVGGVLLPLIEDSRDPQAIARRIGDLKQVLGTLPAGAVQPGADALVLLLAPLSAVDEIRAALTGLPAPPAWRQAALKLVDAAERDLKDVTYDAGRLRDNVEAWFDNAMDRVSGVYKRNVQWFLLFAGLAVSVLTGSDTLRFATTLFANPTLRTELASAAQGQAQNPPPVSEAVARLAPFSLLFGYTDLPTAPPAGESLPPAGQGNPVSFWVQRAVGEVATAFAIMLGAPFWFQLLQRLVNLRGAGPKPVSRSDSQEAARQRAATTD